MRTQMELGITVHRNVQKMLKAAEVKLQYIFHSELLPINLVHAGIAS